MRAPRISRLLVPTTVAGATLAALGMLASAALPAAQAAAIRGGLPASDAAGFRAEPSTSDAAPAGRVVVLGVDGLEWSDVTAQTMPTLATLAGQGAFASLVTRTAGDGTCPGDGWLTLGSGVRSTGGRVAVRPPGADPLSTVPQPVCAPLPAAPSTRGAFTVPGYSSYRAANIADGAAAHLGALAAPLRRAGGCVAASGPGAVLAAADANGRVADYLGPPAALTAADLDACALTLVDLGGYLAADRSAATRYPPPVSRPAVFSAVDARIAALLPQLPTDSALVVAGLDDAAPAVPRLHVLLATGRAADGSAFVPGRRLRAAATRTDGLAQTVDLTPSLLHWIGLADGRIAAADPRGFAGAPLALGSPAPDGDGAAALSAARTDTANVVYRNTSGACVRWLVVAVLVLTLGACAVFGAVARWLRGGRARRLTLLALAATATVVGAAVPASFLAGLDDWAAAAHPARRLYGLIVACAVLLGLAVHAGCRFGRLRDRPLAPAGIIALLTLAVIAGDVSSGSRLQRQTPLGFAFVTGDRFFGIGDRGIGVYCAAAVIGAFFAAELALADRGFALLTVALLALLATTVCGLPFWGDRPRGVIPLAAGFAVLALLTARQRSTWRGLLLGAVRGSDLGGTTDRRRLGACPEHPQTTEYEGAPDRRPGLPLSRSADPDLNLAQPLVLAVTCAVGWAADSAGILLPGTALLLAVPLCLAACALALLRPRPSEAPAAAAAGAADGSATTTAPAGSGSVR